jgi:hypothetical protein
MISMLTASMTEAGVATRLMHGSRSVAPQFAQAQGAESAYVTLGNPVFGIPAVTRVRDAKQAAPPRGVLH